MEHSWLPLLLTLPCSHSVLVVVAPLVVLAAAVAAALHSNWVFVAALAVLRGHRFALARRYGSHRSLLWSWSSHSLVPLVVTASRHPRGWLLLHAPLILVAGTRHVVAVMVLLVVFAAIVVLD
jgi:hypothetical protein